MLLLASVLVPAQALGSDGPSAGVPDYRIAPDPGLSLLAVRACFPGGLPSWLEAIDPAAAGHLESAWVDAGGNARTLAVGEARLSLGAGEGPGCVHYRVDLQRSLTEGWRGWGGRGREAVLVSPRLFLWSPPGGLAGATVDFDLPPGMAVSAPWPASAAPDSEGQPAGGSSSPTRFRIGGRPLDWDGRLALGRFDAFTLALPGGRLDVALLRGNPATPRERIEPWLRANAEALTLASDAAHPRLPVERLQVLVVPLGSGGEPVPWGQVMRGGGDAVHLYIDQTRPQAEFLGDWVLIHELSHLLLPFTDGDGPWLYEGIASYYQNILPGRAGTRAPGETWARLDAGFRRGMAGTKPGESLAQASRDMLRERSFLRVYWSGAAMALLADLELRRRGTGSLDSALAELRRRFGPFDRVWRSSEVVDALDRVSGGRVYGDLARRWLASDRFPDLTDAYQRLGIQARGDTGLHLRDDPRSVSLRAALLGRGGDGRWATGLRVPEVGCAHGEHLGCAGRTLTDEEHHP